MRCLTITGLIVATVVLLGGPMEAQGSDATGAVLVDEWYADLPWHQKLSTKDSNLIDIPFVMPFEALPKNLQDLCTEKKLPKARCMLQYGVVNVMGMQRTDTLYQSEEAPANCPANKTDCVEVKLKVQRFHTATTNNQGYEADVIKNDMYVVPDIFSIPSLGYAITEATIFVPWLPWYTGHYCAQAIDNVHDAVCYEDYFTTMIQATGSGQPGDQWLEDVPDEFSPRGKEGIFLKFCEKNQNFCHLQLGKVNWLTDKDTGDYLMTPKVIPDYHACGWIDPLNQKDRTIAECQTEVEDRTKNLVTQFSASTNDETHFFDDKFHYPWEKEQQTLAGLQEAIKTNPFIGAYDLTWHSRDPQGAPNEGKFWSFFIGKKYVLPKKCTSADYMKARQGITGDNPKDIQPLKDCALDFEIHTNGFIEQWAPLFPKGINPEAIDQIREIDPGFGNNQYGRTQFLFAGVPEQHVAVSFKKLDDGMSIHDKAYGSSLYTQYLPLVNPADLSLNTKSYDERYWHNLLMSNHQNQHPEHFIRGIRGRTLWHNEFRSHLMYNGKTTKNLPNNKVWQVLGHVDFPAGFQVANHTSPFHGNTCDSCHLRNGSGIPLMPNGQLPKIHTDRGMTAHFIIHSPDETYTNTILPNEGLNLPSMKIVLFDLASRHDSRDQCDANDHTTPESSSETLDPTYYKNKIMNFYGNSLHVNQNNKLPTYNMEYVPITKNSGFEVVDNTTRMDRTDPKNPKSYTPMYVAVSGINMTGACKDIATPPSSKIPWPKNCDEVNGAEILKAINSPTIGFMHLLGHRLGNGPLIEMMPDQTIIATAKAQTNSIKFPGCYGLAPGTRGGGATNYRACTSGVRGGEDPVGADLKNDCYISRFGWIGDRASLEDQIANAASVEMNITSKESYDQINPNPTTVRELVRYKHTQCGPADLTCQGEKNDGSNSNSDITEQEIKDMATYQRWIGIPNRSEYQVSSKIVQDGEAVFKRLKCHSCHVIEKIAFQGINDMLPDEERARLKSLKNGQSDYPFISYLGTDLLLHDMGYLSQVAKAPSNVNIRNADGTVNPKYKAWVQQIRTPALKGLRFNRFVTDSIFNTTKPFPPSLRSGQNYPPSEATPASDFLLHDGRAHDAIEAAYLHDGPAIKDLKMIKGLNDLTLDDLNALRAFLYSL